MHFEITKCKNFLGDALLQHTKFIYLYILTPPPKEDLKFGIFSSLIVEFSYANNLPKLIYTYKSKLCILPHQIQIFLHNGALPWTPV